MLERGAWFEQLKRSRTENGFSLVGAVLEPSFFFIYSAFKKEILT